jgi:hypothetical protein
MPNLLTLAMSETKPNTGEFKVVTYSLDENKFYSMEISTRDFKTPEGKIIWDIGAVTFAEKLELESGYQGNTKYKASGRIEFVKHYTRRELVDFFEKKKMFLSEFYSNKDKDYGIIKVDELDKIHKPEIEPVFKNYIEFTAQGSEKKCLNKDFRWVNYWKSASRTGKLDDKIKYFEDLFNRQDKKIYLILYRHMFTNGPQRWIVGFHWL